MIGYVFNKFIIAQTCKRDLALASVFVSALLNVEYILYRISVFRNAVANDMTIQCNQASFAHL